MIYKTQWEAKYCLTQPLFACQTAVSSFIQMIFDYIQQIDIYYYCICSSTMYNLSWIIFNLCSNFWQRALLLLIQAARNWSDQWRNGMDSEAFSSHPIVSVYVSNCIRRFFPPLHCIHQLSRVVSISCVTRIPEGVAYYVLSINQWHIMYSQTFEPSNSRYLIQMAFCFPHRTMPSNFFSHQIVLLLQHLLPWHLKSL